MIICGICGQNYNLFPTIFFISHGWFISHGTHGIHGFFIAARCFFRPQILLIVTNYNFFAHRLHRFKDFFSFLIRLFRLCLKRRSTDWHRFLPNGIYISLIFFLPTDDLFLTDGLVPHGMHGIHGFFIAARCFFRPQITQI